MDRTQKTMLNGQRIPRLVWIIGITVTVYCIGYGMQVIGWRMVENNGGSTHPFPQFFPFAYDNVILYVAVLTLGVAFSLTRSKKAK